MKTLLFGGTGFIGRHLARQLRQADHETWVMTRSSRPGDERCRGYRLESLVDLFAQINEPYAIINLAGAPIQQGRWTARRKQRILQSRVDLTAAIAAAIHQAKRPPAVLVNASAIGYYGASQTAALTEEDAVGEGFLAQVCAAWEDAAIQAADRTRVVRVRVGFVLGADGGALPKMMLPYKLYIGGPFGSGQQWVSWIHIADVAGILQFCMEHPEMAGAVNATSPHPVPMDDLGRALGNTLHRPHWLTVPGWALRLALGEMSALLLEGQKVLPERILRAGYHFQYPALEPALRDIVNKRWNDPPKTP